MIKSILILHLTILSCFGQVNWLTAPIPNSPPVNQLRTDGNACGPACLLDAFRSGSEKWQKSIAQITGKTDNEKIKKIITQFGKLPSEMNVKRARWNGRYGVNATDLAHMANELRNQKWMGTVRQEIFFKTNRESDLALLKRTHKKLTRSLKKGLPPILRVRRVAYRSPNGTSTKAWLNLKSHYLVLTGITEKLSKNATSFSVTYHDPWGGKKHQGTVQIATEQTSGIATLIAHFPDTSVGKSLVKKGETSSLSLSSAVGVF